MINAGVKDKYNEKLLGINACIPPISSHLMQLQAKLRFRIQSVSQAKFIAKAHK